MIEYEGPAQIFVDSRLLADATKVTVKTSGNNKKVFAMGGGRPALRGRSRGALETEITVSNAVPKANVVKDFAELVINYSNVRVVYVSQGKRRIYDGWVDDCTEENGVDGPASKDFTVHAGPPSIL